MTLIDLPTAKLHLRVTEPEEDALIALYADAAEAHVVQFLGRNVYPTQEALSAAAEPVENGPILVNSAIKAAILLILGSLYANREDVVTGTPAMALPNGAQYLLQPYRFGMGI